MNGIVFHKMSGSGNDFVMLDGRHSPAEGWTPDRVRAMCDRRGGVGADGLAVLTPTGDGALRLDYWNRDGSAAALCGNASLCAIRLAAQLELAPAAGMALQTPAGEVQGRVTGPGQAAAVRLPSFALPTRVDLPLGPGEQAMLLGTVGVPHLVVLVEDVRAVDVAARGAALRSDPALGPEGANVDFVSPPGPGDSAWQLRTYERGVEAETLSCGTGTVAAAAALCAAGRAGLPVELVTPRGLRLAVSGQVAGGWVTEPWLLGEGRHVYTGILGASSPA